jgi:hypothetical protein
MIRVINAKLTEVFGNRLFLAVILCLVLLLNFEILVNSGLLQPRLDAQGLNETLRYTLLINNFDIIFQTWGLLIPIFLGCQILANEKASGQIYVTLTGNPRRTRYLFANWVSLVIVTLIIFGIVVLNYWVLAYTLKIKTVFPDFAAVMGTILVNMIVLLTVTSAAASIGSMISGIIGGLAALTIFNLSAYQMIPFVVGSYYNFSTPIRRLLATLAPIRVVYSPCLARASALSQYIVHPFFPGGAWLWQLTYIGVVVSLALVVFNKRDL